MKLSMWIFADWLKKYKPKTDIQANLFAIEAVRLFSTHMELDHKTLYIGRLGDFFQNGGDAVICTHNNDMIRLQTDDLEEVLNEVLNAFEFYASWNNGMLELLAANTLLPDLFTASRRILGHPLFLLDAGFRLLAYNTDYGIGQVDGLWDELLLTGASNEEFLIKLNQAHPKRFREKGIYFYGKDVFPHHCYNRNFFFQNDWVGTVILVDLAETISQGTLDLFAMFGSYLNRWFQIHIQEQHSIVLNHLLHAAVTDKTAGTEELRRQLTLFGWQETDTLLFIRLDAANPSVAGASYLCHTLNFNFEDLYAIPVEFSICLLCNISKCPQQPLYARLLSWLARSSYYGTAGQPFSLGESFFSHYQYAALAAEHCPKEPGKLYEGAKYSLHYMFYEMRHALVPPVPHPALGILWAYDRQNHTELYATLYSYLKNERSLARTAKELRLHRNSLSYRLSRIRALLADSLEDYHTRLYILLSYEIDFFPQN